MQTSFFNYFLSAQPSSLTKICRILMHRHQLLTDRLKYFSTLSFNHGPAKKFIEEQKLMFHFNAWRRKKFESEVVRCCGENVFTREKKFRQSQHLTFCRRSALTSLPSRLSASGSLMIKAGTAIDPSLKARDQCSKPYLPQSPRAF